jgi:hypothetical protein
MVRLSPRLSPRLLAEIDRLSRRDLSFAEINRSVGATAETLGLPRPSYESVRLLVRAARELRSGPSTFEVVLDVATRARSPMELLDFAEGLPIRDLNPERRRRK